MNQERLAAFQRRAFETESALFGKDCVVAGSAMRLLVRKVDALDAAQGGFEEGGGELSAQYQGPTPPAVHSLAVVDGKNYRVLSVVTAGGSRFAITLRPTNSSK